MSKLSAVSLGELAGDSDRIAHPLDLLTDGLCHVVLVHVQGALEAAIKVLQAASKCVDERLERS